MENIIQNNTDLTVAKSNLEFKKDVNIGEDGEEIIKQLLLSKGFKFIRENRDYKYDLLMSFGDRDISFEIKTDVYVDKNNDTGNLVVEYECRNKPSGISVTQADYYVYYMPKLNEVWNIHMDNLKYLIKNNNFYSATGGDEGSNTKMYLIRREYFKDYFKIHKT
tara:strand:- start:380 stop:871 length:492 start_codon:yes stop_codon:yes gene_type:complete